MKPEQSSAASNVVFLPLWTGRGANLGGTRDETRDQTLAELRELWPNVVDLAKQPGVLYRLHAMLSA